ncbi:pLS20_p028 family conjugation system transmembrane protein [Lactococcus lactis]|uniref:pLS20_p028 family conjugation system transmembrane protein n=1 Tax=Lactococcus lactis TaxID=1358 RepID=UPI001255DEFB|nr:hypothetical protein [Lactococcus lactis]TYR25539.1 hypothetical protein FYK05_06665 [Lactococcus lactis subsp. lactis bv. diacetylactis]
MKRKFSKLKLNKPWIMMMGIALIMILTPMIVQAANPANWAPPKVGDGLLGGGDVTNKAEAINFYNYFSTYLTPMGWGWLAIPVSMFGKLFQALCSLADTLQSVFFTSVKFLGIFSSLSDANSDLGKLAQASQRLGLIIFVVTVTLYGFFVIFNGKSKTAKSILTTFIIATFGLSVVPWGLNKINGFVQDSMAGYQQATGNKSVGLSIIQRNVVDKFVLNEKNWNATLNESGGVLTQPEKYNVIKSINDWDAGEVAGVMSHDLLEGMDKKNGPNDASAVAVFEHRVQKTIEAKGGVEVLEDPMLTTIKYHSTLGIANMAEANYLRYKVSWLSAFIEVIATDALFALMTVKVILSLYQIVSTYIVGGVLAAIRAKDSKKAKGILSSIFFGAMGVLFDLIVVYISIDIIAWLQSASALDIMSGIPTPAQLLLRALAYVGVFFGSFAGVGIVEKYLGVSSGQGNALRQAMAGAMIVSTTFSAMKTAGGMTLSGAKKTYEKVKSGLSYQPSSSVNSGGGTSGKSWSAGTGSFSSTNSTNASESNPDNSKASSTGNPFNNQGEGQPQAAGPTGEGDKQSNRQEEAKKNMEQQAPQSPSSEEANSWDSGIETPQPKSNRREEAKQKLEQQASNGGGSDFGQASPENSGTSHSNTDGSGSSNDNSDGLEKQSPNPTNDPFEQLHNRMDQFGGQVEDVKNYQQSQIKQQRKAQTAQKRMQRSQRMNQAMNTLSSSGAESHIGKQESEEE